MKELIEKSKEIVSRAISDFKPDAIVSMVSGGNDSAVADAMLREIGIIPDFVMHGNTRTGIRETTEFVRRKYQELDGKYIEADAGTAFEDYVLRKGFFGKGRTAHTYCYHIIKAGPFRKALSRHIRKGRRNIKILLINGARVSESDNRAQSKPDVYNFDPAQKGNIWVNIIHHWTKDDCNRYIQSRKIDQNPVTKKMCRSGECLCGTMQRSEELLEAELLFPEWGEWRKNLEKKVIEAGFPWRLGEPINKQHILEKHGQKRIKFDDFQPMCVDCNSEA